MFIFYLLGVGLPCLSIFCQFWLCEEAQCVYLRRHLGSPPTKIFLKKKKYLTQEARAYNGVKTLSLVNGIGKIGQVHAEK